MPIKIMEEDYNDELYAHFFKALFQLREIRCSIMINHESKVDTMRSLCLTPCSVMDLHGTFFSPTPEEFRVEDSVQVGNIRYKI